MILITGANGQLGTATINFLLQQKPTKNIVALVADDKKRTSLREKGVITRSGDYFDKRSLVEAMAGTDTLVLISSRPLNDRITQHGNAIRAAIEAGVKHIIYTSILKADSSLSIMSDDHIATEKLIQGSGINYTIFRNTIYVDLLSKFLGSALKTGQWSFPSRGQKVNMAVRGEIGEALAIVASNPHLFNNKVMDITSGKSYSLNEIAAIISRVTGKYIRYNDITLNQFKKELRDSGLSQEAVAWNIGLAASIRIGETDYIAHTMRERSTVLY